MNARYPQASAACIDRARRGDMSAHAELYATFAPMVYTLACRMLASRSLGEDVVQETFVEVIRKIDTWRGDSELGLWVRRIAVNKCLMHLRSSWVSRRDPLDTEPSTSDGADDEAGALERALQTLPDVARAVVLLHDVEGYTHQEIGRLMKRSASFSKSQLARAHERLRALLDDTAGKRHKLCRTALKTC